MKSSIQISCNIATSDAAVPLGLEIWVDDHQIFDLEHVTENISFDHVMDDDEAEHELRFVMKNKTVDHTQLDASGNIVKDACVIIDDLAFDQIRLGHMFTELATYTHDFNGHGQQVQEKFYGSMGCNGTVSLKFTTPIYLWLLEHM